MTFASIIVAALCGLLALAAAMDVWKLRISNLFPLAILLLFPVWIAQTGWHISILQNLAMFAVTFVGGAFVFSRGWLGGGDVKLLAATALWFDFRGAGALFLWVALGGAILSIVFVVLRRMISARLEAGDAMPSLRAGGPIPYGVAIAGGAILAIMSGQISPQPASKVDSRSILAIAPR